VSPRRIDPRRQDRSRDETWIRDFLLRSPAGVLATAPGGVPYAVPTLFAYDPEREALYLHSAPVGRTRGELETGEAGEEGTRVAFVAFEMGRILPSPDALEFGLEYASVMVFGRGGVVGDAAEAERALRLLLEKYAPHLRPGVDYHDLTAAEVARTAVYRIEIEEWSGKARTAPSDAPGAYRYEDVTPGTDRDGGTSPEG